MESLPVRSVNLGTGENGMHPQFREILDYLRTLPVKLTITSNGHSAAVLTDDELRAFHDIEFSLDYPTEAAQDSQRGSGNLCGAGNPRHVHRGHDEVELFAPGRSGADSEALRFAAAAECLSGGAF